MANTSNQEKVSLIIGAMFVLIGVICNEWLLSYLFAAGGIIPFSVKIVIWFFNLIMVITGIFIIIKRKLIILKQLAFNSIIIFFMILAVEVSLHFIRFIVHKDNQKEIGEVRLKHYLTLQYYKEKEWAEDLFREMDELPGSYKPYVGWAKNEYHGKHINISSDGVRKSWNLDNFQGQKFKTIYVLGGSTTWGFGSRDDYTIPSYISKELHKKGYNFKIYNYSEYAYTFTQGIIRLVLLLRDGHRPDYVITYDGINDIWTAFQSGEAGTLNNQFVVNDRLKRLELSNTGHIWFGIKNILENHCLIYRELKKIKKKFEPSSSDIEGKEVGLRLKDKELYELSESIVEYYAQTLKFLDDLSKLYGFKYISFWQPVSFTEDKLTNEEVAADFTINNKQMAKFYKFVQERLNLETSPANFHNLSNVLKERTKSYYVDWAHLSEEGNEEVAKTIVNIFEKEVLKK